MIYLSTEEVLLLHEYQIETFGGSHGILNPNLLESAVLRPQASFSGEEVYKSVFEKAAVLMIGLIKNHPFVDGNKRTGLHASLVFLKLNGVSLKAPNEKLVKIAVRIARGKLSVEAVAKELERWAG